MAKEIVIDHKDIDNSQTITDRMVDTFKDKGLDIHVNEVQSIEDDFKKGKRILKVKNTKYFFMGG